MADEKFVIEILLEARNQIGGALEAAGVEVDKLQKRFQSATTSAGRLDDRMEKLDRGVGKAAATFRSINPTLEAFDRRLDRIRNSSTGVATGLEKMFRRLEKVNVGLESTIKTIDRAERVITKLEARLDELGLRKFQPEVDVKISGKEKLDAFLLELQILTQKVYKARTDVETRDAENKVERLRAKMAKAGFGDQADNVILQVGIDIDKSDTARLDELSRKADEAARVRNIKFTLEGEAHVKSEVQALLREIDVLKKEDIGITAILKRTQFDSEYDRILADIAVLSQSTAAPNVKLNKKQYEIEKALLLADLAHLGLKSETISVKLDVKQGIGNRIAGIGQQIDDAIGDKGLLTSRKLTNAIINLAVAFAEPLLSAVTAVGGGMIALAASAGQAVVGVGALASAAAAEAVPALGLLAFSLNRVQNVVKAVGLAYKEQQQKGQQQISLDQARASAADGIRSAEEGVANAQRAVITSQEALNKARKDGVRQIEDLMFAELRATRTAQQSRLGLAASIGLGTGSVIDAQLQAESDQVTATRATTDSKAAQAGGIEGLDSVIAAKRQLQDAVRGVADAQHQLDAAGRQAEAASARLIRSANAFQIAYSQLSEGERALFSVLHNKSNTGLLDLFQNNLDSPIRKVTDTVLFSVARMATGITKLLTDPKIVGAFQSLADSISGVFDGIAKAISSGPVADAIAFFTKESSKNIGPVAHIFGDLLKIFLAIAHAAAGPLTSAIGSVSGFLDKLVGKVSSPEGQGSLSAWFTAALKPIGSILRLGGAVVNLFLALVGAGGAADAGTKGIDGLTRSIDKATKYINTHSKEVSRFFDQSIKALGYVGDVIVGIGKLLVKSFKAESVKDFASLINDVVLPSLYFFITTLGLVVKALASLFRVPVLGDLLKFAILAGGTTLIVARLAETVSGLLKLFAAEGALRTFIGWLGKTRIGMLLTSAATYVLRGAWLALSFVVTANPIVLAVGAIIALGAAFYLAYKKIKPFHDAVDAVFSFIKSHWKTIVEVMLGPLGLVIFGLTKFGPRLLHAFENAFKAVFGFFKSLPGQIGDLVSEGIHKLGSVFESLGERIVKAIVRGIKSAPKALLHALESVIPGGKLLGKGLEAVGGIVGLATGGKIAGNPADGDSVHVRVKPGEVILNEIQQRSVGTSAISAALTGAPTISNGGGYATGGKAARPTSASSTLAAIVNLADNETDDIANNFVTMRKRIEKSLSSLVDSATSSWRDFWKAGDRNLGRLEDSIAKSFKSIGDTVYEGFSYIEDSASRSLKALGGKQANFGLHRLSLSSDAVTKADGGWIGNQGERGADRVHTILGRGEAVLNYAHQKIVEPALRAAYGFGLPEMFKRTNALHAGPALGMATGGFAGNVNFFGHPSNVTPTVRRLLGTVEQRWPEATVTSTTDHSVNTTSGNRSLHVDGMAFDIAGEPGYMNRMADWIKSSGIYKNLTEGIHNPNLSVKNGEIVPNTFWGPAVWAQHANHIHLGVRGTVNAFKAASTKIRKQIVDGSGVLASVAQRAVNALTKSAQKKVDGGGGGDTQSQGIKILAAAGGRRVGATTFGGPADPGTGATGYRGDNLHQFPNSYAELSNPGTLDFAALGGLPYKTRLRITAPTGRSAIALKRDVGKGGPSVGGVKRGIDLWYELAEKLGVGNVWSGVVKVAKAARGGFIEPVQQFAQGGIVKGIKDSVQPVVAHAGEMVLNGAQQSKLWKMATGGTVGAPRENKDTGETDWKKLAEALAIPYGFVAGTAIAGLLAAARNKRNPLAFDPHGPGGLDQGMITEYEAFGRKRVGVITGFNKISGDPYIKEAGQNKTKLISRSQVFPESSALSRTVNAYKSAMLFAQLAEEPKQFAAELKAEKKRQRVARRNNSGGIEIYRGTPNTDPGKFELYDKGTGVRGPGTHASSDRRLAESYADPEGAFAYKKRNPGSPGFIYSTKLNLRSKGISWAMAEKLPRESGETVTDAARRHGYDFMENRLYKDGGKNSDIILLTQKAIARQSRFPFAGAAQGITNAGRNALKKILDPINDYRFQRYLAKTYPKTLEQLGSSKPGHFGYDDKKIERIDHRYPGSDEILIYSEGNAFPDHAYAAEGEGPGRKTPEFKGALNDSTKLKLASLRGEVENVKIPLRERLGYNALYYKNRLQEGAKKIAVAIKGDRGELDIGGFKPAGKKVYHVAPTALRKKIEAEGLIPDGPLLNADAGHERGVYVWDDPEVAWKYRGQGPNMYRDMDVWEVDPKGANLERDPWFDTHRPDQAHKFPGGSFSREPIPAKRVKIRTPNPWFTDKQPHPEWAKYNALRSDAGEVSLRPLANIAGKFGQVARFAGPLVNRFFAASAIKDVITGHLLSGLSQAAGFIPGVGGLYATALLQAALHNNKNLPTRGPERAKLDKQNYDAGRTGPALGGRLQHAPTPAPAPKPVPLSHFAQEEIKKRSRLKKAPYKGFKQRVFAAGGFVDPGIEWGGAQASGGDYIVKKPTLFLAGEAGHERATFSPIRAAAGFPGYPPLTKPEDFGKPGAFGGSPSLPGAIPQPKPLASPHTYDPPSKPRTTAPTTTTAASSGSGSSSGSSGGSGGSGGGSTQTAASKAAEKAKKAFQKILDDAKKIFEDAAKAANFDQRASLTKATRSVVASFGKLVKKSKDALGALSTAIDYVLTDQNGPIAVIEAIAAARSAVLRRRSTQRQFSVTKNSGGVTAGVRTNAINPQAAELRNLGDDRLGLQAENRILGTVQADAQKGYAKASKLQSEAEADLAKAKKAKDKKAEEKAKSDLEDAKKLVAQFKGEVNKTRAKREDVRSKLAENAQAIVEQQEALQQTAFDSFTGFFDRLGSIMERTRRRFTARGKEAPLDLFDISIARNTQEIDGLQKQLTKANKSGNKELAKTIQDKIDELQVSIEEIAAQKFQAQIDAVNKSADTKLSANDFSAKLASLGVDPGAFSRDGVSSLNLAQLGQPNYAAVGSSLKERGGILEQQRGGIADLLAQAVQAGNTDKIDDLTKQLQTLDGAIIDNAVAIRANTDAALQAHADARLAPGSQNLSIDQAGLGLLQATTNATGISSNAQQAAILAGSGKTLKAQQHLDSISFGAAVNDKVPGIVDYTQLDTLQGPALIDYIKSVVGFVQARTDKYSPDEIAAITAWGTSILTDATAVQDNTKALKDLNGSLVQSFASTGWQRFRQAIFDGNNGLLPQYQSFIPSFGNGGTMMHDGLATLHRNEVVLTPGEARDRNKVQAPVNEETHFHLTSPTEVVDPVWLARQTSFRRRING